MTAAGTSVRRRAGCQCVTSSGVRPRLSGFRFFKSGLSRPPARGAAAYRSGHGGPARDEFLSGPKGHQPAACQCQFTEARAGRHGPATANLNLNVFSLAKPPCPGHGFRINQGRLSVHQGPGT